MTQQTSAGNANFDSNTHADKESRSIQKQQVTLFNVIMPMILLWLLSVVLRNSNIKKVDHFRVEGTYPLAKKEMSLNLLDLLQSSAILPQLRKLKRLTNWKRL